MADPSITITLTKRYCQILFSDSVKCFQVLTSKNYISEIGFNLYLQQVTRITPIFIFYSFVHFKSAATLFAFTTV